MALGLVGFHLVVNRQYGFHGDELYFLDCGNRPAWGYVDHPPFVPMVAHFATALFGLNLFALRLFPALALGLGCFLTGWLARRLGAGSFGEFLACLCFVAAPMMIRVGAFLNIPCFEVVFWLIAAHVLVTIERHDGGRWWLAVGVLCGVALLNKHTTLFLGTGIAVGLLLTHRRKDLGTPWPWLGGALAFLIFAPNLIWQYRNDWATLDFVQQINALAMGSRLEFVLGQVVLMNLASFWVMAAGLLFYFRDLEGRKNRMLGWVFITALLIMLVLRAKVYYLLPAYPILFAGGAVWVEQRWIGAWGRVKRGALSVAIGTVGLILLPIVAPVGSVEWKDAYCTRVLGFMVEDPVSLTFDFHYQLGRPEELARLKAICDGLTPDEQAFMVILTDEYDTVSAIHWLGRDMPLALSGSNSHYLWGPQGATGACVVVLGYDEALLKTCFSDVRRVGEVPLRGGDTVEGKPIYVCRKPVAPLDAMWPRFKRYR